MTIKDRDKIIIELYQSGKSSYQIQEGNNFGISTRQIQRVIKSAGVVRGRSESFKLAIKHGRMTYYKLPEHLKKHRRSITLKQRYRILERDGFACVKCGATAKDGVRIEIDHINENPQDNIDSNLQVLCSFCNKGKSYND